MWTYLTWSHIRLLFSYDYLKTNYYIHLINSTNISVRTLENKIKTRNMKDYLKELKV